MNSTSDNPIPVHVDDKVPVGEMTARFRQWFGAARLMVWEDQIIAFVENEVALERELCKRDCFNRPSGIHCIDAINDRSRGSK